MSDDAPKTVTIRFRKQDEEHAIEFQHQAKEAGMSTTDYARKLLFDALYPTEQQQIATLSAEVKLLQNTLRALRNDLATSVNCLLVNAGKLNQEEARAWIEDQISSH